MALVLLVVLYRQARVVRGVTGQPHQYLEVLLLTPVAVEVVILM